MLCPTTCIIKLIVKEMGTCISIDASSDYPACKPKPRANTLPNIHKQHKQKNNTVNESSELSYRQDEFLSRYKMSIHGSTDPIDRAVVMKGIVSEFKEEFDQDVSYHVLYDFYNIY